MKRIPYEKYTKEFRPEAIKLVTDGGLSILEASKRLSLAPSTLSNWIKKNKSVPLKEVGKNHPQLSDKEMELARLKRELAEVKKGNCYDNAPIESFWGMLKQELVHQRNYRTRQKAIQDITEYIEVFYNRQRKQKRLGYLSPAAYEKKFYEKRLSA